MIVLLSRRYGLCLMQIAVFFSIVFAFMGQWTGFGVQYWWFLVGLSIYHSDKFIGKALVL